MSEQTIMLILKIVGLYLLVGAIFSVIFLLKGLEKVDADAKGTSWSFKLLIFPGLCVFWVKFLLDWIKVKS